MKDRRTHIGAAVAAAAALVAAALLVVMPALATPPQGVVTTTFGVGRFDNIDATTLTQIAGDDDTDSGRAVKSRHEGREGHELGFRHDGEFWKGRIQTRGASDLYVLQNTIAPNGTFGWHSHPGPSLVIVKSGTATLYMADDPACSPQVVQAGQGFVDNGHDTHVVRNEGTVDLVTVVVSLVPAGFQRRVDEPAPANCPKLQQG